LEWPNEGASSFQPAKLASSRKLVKLLGRGKIFGIVEWDVKISNFHFANG